MVTWVTPKPHDTCLDGRFGEPLRLHWRHGLAQFADSDVLALNMVFQYRRIGPWRNVLYGERVYMVLSPVAKSAPAWPVLAGALRPA